MPKSKTKTEKEETFNWKGITDNGDGTFTVADKHAKNRLSKEFRKQGIRSHSKRTGEKGFIMFPVGQRKKRALGRGRLSRKERQYYPGLKPNTRVRGIKPGPRPQFRQQVRPGFGSPPVIHGGYRPNKHPISTAIMKAADKRAQKVREEQRSPYTPSGEARPGYIKYKDPRTGAERIVRRPTGTWRDRFRSKEEKEKARDATRYETQERWKGIEERSNSPEGRALAKQRIPKPQIAPGGHVIRQSPAPSGVHRTTELPQERRSEPGQGPITSSGVKRTSELPEHKVSHEERQQQRIAALEKFQKVAEDHSENEQ